MLQTIRTWKLHLTLVNVQLHNAKRSNLFVEVARLQGFKDALSMCIEEVEDLNPQPSDDDPPADETNS